MNFLHEFFIDDRIQHTASKIFMDHMAQAVDDLVGKFCNFLKTRQGIQKPVESAEIYQFGRRREVPIDQGIRCDQSPKGVGDDRIEVSFLFP